MSRNEVVIRPAKHHDISSVVLLERSVAEAAHWAEGEYSTIATSRGGEGVRRCFLVAESRGELVGFVVGKVIGGGETWGELENVAVAVAARRAGTGRALCEAAMAWFREQGAKRAELEVRSANRAATALYEKMGFRRVGLRKGYYREPVDDALLMRVEFVDEMVLRR